MIWQNGSNLGHMIAGARIVDYHTGGKPTLLQAALRTIPEISYELFIPIFINAYMIITREDHRHTFDIMAGTISVRRVETESEAKYTDDYETEDPTIYRESERPRF